MIVTNTNTNTNTCTHSNTTNNKLAGTKTSAIASTSAGTSSFRISISLVAVNYGFGEQSEEKSTENFAPMEQDSKVSILKNALETTRLCTPLKRKMVTEIFGQEASLEPKVTRRRLSITPIQNDISQYVHVDPNSKIWINLMIYLIVC